MIKLSDTQRKIVEHRDGALLVIAGAGSGKTRVLTERVRNLLENKIGHYRVLALTFTNKAAEEMRERLSDITDLENKAFIGTMHSFCMEVVNQRGSAIGLQGIPHIFSSTGDLIQILSDVFKGNPSLQSILIKKEKPQQFLGQVYQFISEQKRSLRSPEFFLEKPDESDEVNLFAYLYRQYDDMLRAQNAIDFDDLLLLTYKIFTERPKIADMYRRLYKFICIDEAQDLNFAQYNVLKSICGEQFKNVMMVGDPRQAIYGFNDASSEFMCSDFVKDFSPIQIELTENFRSSKAVIQVAQILEPDFQMEGILPIQGEVQAFCCANEQEEAEWVVKYLEELSRKGHNDIEGKVTWNKCAILARNRYVAKQIEEKLSKSSIPYYIRLTSAQESESELIKCFELGMRLLINPADYIHFQQLAKLLNVNNTDIALHKSTDDGNTILRNLYDCAMNSNRSKDSWHNCGDALLSAWKTLTDDNPNFLKALGILEKCAESTFENEIQQKEMVVNDIAMWKQHWKKYVSTSSYGSRTLTQFRNQVALGTTQLQTEKDAVALLTVHTSKGLEFDVVFVIGMCEGIFPDYRAIQKQGKALLEEQHNAFVAVTRSKRLLYITYPKFRKMPWGDIRAQSPSRYLTQMEIPIFSTE